MVSGESSGYGMYLMKANRFQLVRSVVDLLEILNRYNK
jgi:hypothetical protein